MEHITQDGMMDFSKYPTEFDRNKYLLIEYKDTDFENILGTFDSEIKAYIAYKKVKHNSKKVVKVDIEYITVFGTEIMTGYTEIQ